MEHIVRSSNFRDAQMSDEEALQRLIALWKNFKWRRIARSYWRHNLTCALIDVKALDWNSSGTDPGINNPKVSTVPNASKRSTTDVLVEIALRNKFCLRFGDAVCHRNGPQLSPQLHCLCVL